MGQDLLVIENLKKYFVTSQGVVRAVDGVNFAIQKGETLGLVGESGSGKTTVGYTLLGAYAPTEGSVLFEGQDIGQPLEKRPKSLKRQIQMVFQDPGTSLNPTKQIREQIELPMRVHGMEKKDRLVRVRELLSMVELPEDYLFKYPRELGGGEKQAVAIARALAAEPSFIILDEPTSALDVSIQAKIINILSAMQQKFNLTYLFITHDLSLMRNVATRVAIMYLGKVCELAPAEEFFRRPLHPYTQMLLSSIPVLTDEEEALKPQKIVSRGEIPSPVNIPPGCSFHLRCPERMEICFQALPALQEVEKDHLVSCHLHDIKTLS